jgi:AhpD family alkylhydroperoxidase
VNKVDNHRQCGSCIVIHTDTAPHLVRMGSLSGILEN